MLKETPKIEYSHRCIEPEHCSDEDREDAEDLEYRGEVDNIY